MLMRRHTQNDVFAVFEIMCIALLFLVVPQILCEGPSMFLERNWLHAQCPPMVNTE